MENYQILGELFDKKLLIILKLFFNNKEKELYLRQIAKETKVPVTSTFRILKKLIDLKIIEEIKIKNIKFYKTLDNENTKFLSSFMKEERKILNIFIKEAEKILNIQQIILHGEEKENKANLLIIGENINGEEIKKIAFNIKTKYDFTISYLTLTREQFEQMSKMGLYAGKKKILFSR